MNKVILTGRVGKDPDVRYMTEGACVVNLSLATAKKWKDKDGGKKESTEWHRIAAFEPLSKVITDYVGKGDLLSIVGELKTRKWQDKDGSDRYVTEIICKELEMLGSKKDKTSNETRDEDEEKSAADDIGNEDIPF